MKERGIIFSGPMVRALLEGRKTQTRRIVKPPRGWADRFPNVDPWCLRSPGAVWWWDGRHKHTGVKQDCPYGQPGDRLWVKEAWGVLYPQYINDADELTFWKADYSNQELEEQILPKWKSPLFMPRSRSRILLEITGVRVKRLQDISEEDARAEGVDISDEWTGCADDLTGSHAKAYQFLWESINGSGSWDENPFCWVLEFRRIEP